MTSKIVKKRATLWPDIIRSLLLVLLSILIWCAVYNRWTVASWKVPITYTADPAKGDVIFQFATIKAAGQGHILPVIPTNIPELGAPYEANWDDFPSTEKGIYWLSGLLSRFIGIFAAANFVALFADVLSALSFYLACRFLRYSWIWAFSGALVFAFARFGFAHQLHHIPTAYVWHIPFYVVLLRWLIDPEGITFGGVRFKFAVVIAIFTGIQSPYYTNMFAQFLILGTVVLLWRKRDVRVCIIPGALMGVAAAAFVFMNSNTFLYHIMNGGNSGAVVRSYHWLEVYGLKLVDMVMPPPDHRFPIFSAWSASHLAPGEIILSPGEIPPTAYLGLIGIAAFAWLAISSVKRVLTSMTLPMEAWLVLWIMLYSEVGGVNGILGTLGFQLFRATTRYSIIILCIVLMYAIRRLSQKDMESWLQNHFPFYKPNSWISYGVAGIIVLFAIWDQTPPFVSDREIRQTATAIESDRNFSEAMETRLPPKAMVFQIPVMQFPESPGAIGSYDHFRPYLYSKNLRYSFGSDKGRPREAWQAQMAKTTQIDEFVSKLESYGFAAIYVNRNAFQDGGEAFVKALHSVGRDNIIVSEKGDLFCVFLKPSPQPVLPKVYGS